MQDSKVIIDSIWKLYEQVRTYDIHYSNVRVTLNSFLILVTGYEFYFLHVEYKTVAVIGLIVIPVFTVFLSNWLLQACKVCWKIEGKLEKLAIKLMVNHQNSENFNQVNAQNTLCDELKNSFCFLDERKDAYPKGFGIFNICKVDFKEIGNVLFLLIATLGSCLAWQEAPDVAWTTLVIILIFLLVTCCLTSKCKL